jgi:hypothetical protein
MSSKLAFVAMPFAVCFDGIFRDAIVPAAADAGLNLNKLETLPIDVIVPRMQAEIARSDFVIGVTTGRNPHVFFEIGLAHAVGKPCVLIAEQETDFEIFGGEHCCFTYDSDLVQLRRRLREEFARLMKA